jgi:hypothetical protein
VILSKRSVTTSNFPLRVASERISPIMSDGDAASLIPGAIDGIPDVDDRL